MHVWITPMLFLLILVNKNIKYMECRSLFLCVGFHIVISHVILQPLLAGLGCIQLLFCHLGVLLGPGFSIMSCICGGRCSAVLFNTGSRSGL